MDVREKLVELLGNIYLPMMAGPDVIGEYRIPHKFKKDIADHLIANGVTVQEWISVDDGLPQYTDEYNVTVGVPSEFGYFEKVETLRFERIKGKEPRWVIPKNEIYNVIAWMELPKKYKPPKGE